jgi:glyceraldehyde 3-phosphate dehydrogenase
MARVAINGFGRIGRALFKQLVDIPELDVVAINDLAPVDNLAYLLRYDTAYGVFEKSVQHEGRRLIVDGTAYPVLAEGDPAKLPWHEIGIDLVLECTGTFNKREDLQKHMNAGARHILLSAPTKSEDVPTIVYGVNHTEHPGTLLASCASCTTNCIAPLVEVLGRRIGVRKAALTTLHAYTATQELVDGPNKKFRRGRAAAANFVPSSTGAAIATTRALPKYAGKFDGFAVRAPIVVGSLADVVLLVERATSASEVNSIFSEEAQTERYSGVLAVTTDPIVSSDVVKQPVASLVDLGLTQVVDGDLVKVLSWYDNEWGYASQMIREACYVLHLDASTARL